MQHCKTKREIERDQPWNYNHDSKDRILHDVEGFFPFFFHFFKFSLFCDLLLEYRCSQKPPPINRMNSSICSAIPPSGVGHRGVRQPEACSSAPPEWLAEFSFPPKSATTSCLKIEYIVDSFALKGDDNSLVLDHFISYIYIYIYFFLLFCSCLSRNTLTNYRLTTASRWILCSYVVLRIWWSSVGRLVHYSVLTKNYSARQQPRFSSTNQNKPKYARVLIYCPSYNMLLDIPRGERRVSTP